MLPNDRFGYQYCTKTFILGTAVPTLLDTGAAVNSITEELVVGMINKARSMVLRADHDDFPIWQFEKWHEEERVHGVAAGATVRSLPRCGRTVAVTSDQSLTSSG